MSDDSLTQQAAQPEQAEDSFVLRRPQPASIVARIPMRPRSLGWPQSTARFPHAGLTVTYDPEMHELLEPDALIDRFRTAITRRVAAERQIETRFEQGDDPEEQRYRALLESAEQSAADLMSSVHSEYADVVAQFDEFEATERTRIRGDFASAETKAVGDCDRQLAEIDKEYREKDWVVDSLIDEQADNSPQRLLEQLNASESRTREYHAEVLTTLRERVAKTAKYWKQEVPEDPRTYPDMIPATLKAAQVDEQFQKAVDDAETNIDRMRRLKLARITRGPLCLLWFIAGTALVALPAGLLLDHQAVGASEDQWWQIVTAIGSFFGVTFAAILTGLGYSSRRAAWNNVSESFQEAVHQHQGWCIRADVEYGSTRERLLKEIEERTSLKSGKQQTLASHRARREAEVIEQRDKAVSQASAKRDEELDRLKATLVRQRAAAEQVYQQRREQAEQESRDTTADAMGALQRYLGSRGDEFGRLKRQMVDGWQAALKAVEVELADRRSEASVPAWDELASSEWRPASRLPNGLRLGDLIWQTSNIEDAVSGRAELDSLDDAVAIPAVLNFPGNPSVVFRGKGTAAREAAERSLQSFLLRAFTSIPPAQMRVTLLDPVGLGEPFSPFMHLTDVDERLVAGRIWTEPQQIEAQLANLTEHMENVLQTYLRGDFPTIEAYNEMAGEVAEPYRFLVVNGFPHRFSEAAVRRLLSIISNGPRCGVFVAMYHDSATSPTSNLSLDAVDEECALLHWDAGEGAYVVRRKQDADDAQANTLGSSLEDALSDGFAANADQSQPEKPTAKPITLRFEPTLPPEPSQFSQIIRNVGNASKDAGRVEVSFGKIAPMPDKRWTSDSRRGLDVPLGRAGATKLQHARFGRGTAQHMLVAGKTGSGKSTFLHALITNAALHYSPRELRFYLIDFKKGVEFKAYAPDENGGKSFLPHADVIAVESEREFGVSALKRLDQLLNERGELFRAAGVQDVGQYRDENPDVDMPRVMLLIDEFQEFFVEDDALAQQASLLLDRLIRQGRAFGVHCVLGSQTLGGAYSLARSTLGQIGIRVALQCSEADAHLILAEDNTAARLLARPGEAIYNDAGGLVEGNQPFQVAFLTDDQREKYLDQLATAAEEAGAVSDPPVVFEGNKPAMLTRALIDAPLTTPPRFALGDAVEIKPPTSVQLTRRSSGNTLIVGTAADQTRGLLVAAAAQLASTREAESSDATTSSCRVFVLHTPDVDHGVWQKAVERLGLNVTLATSTSIADVLTELDSIRVARDGSAGGSEPYVLIVDGLQNYRQLRRPEDDYGFSTPSFKSPFGSSEEEPPPPPPADPGKLFTDLLAEGPERGLFVVASVDGYPAADRALGRKGLREFGTRVLFRLSANDSSSLIDSPAASKLDSLRGLVYDDATGESEKFRPFAVPKDDDFDRLTGVEPEPDEPSPSSSGPTPPAEPVSGEDSDDKPLDDAALDDFLVH